VNLADPARTGRRLGGTVRGAGWDEGSGERHARDVTGAPLLHGAPRCEIPKFFGPRSAAAARLPWSRRAEGRWHAHRDGPASQGAEAWLERESPRVFGSSLESSRKILPGPRSESRSSCPLREDSAR
jgi:hypothetical protein